LVGTECVLCAVTVSVTETVLCEVGAEAEERVEHRRSIMIDCKLRNIDI